MSFLVALAAFAAIISVYSTIVTVLVEGLHKVLGLRSSGLNEMLRTFHDETLSKLQPDQTYDHERAFADEESKGPSKGAKRFADKIALAESSQSPKFWYASRWPLIGRFFKERRRTLTTLEFVECLAETPEGAALQHYPRAELRQALGVAAYQFERLGERHNTYFRSRANMLAVLVGIAVAAFANFDAIAVFRALSTNAELSSRVTLAINHERLELINQFANDGDASGIALLEDDFTDLAGNVRSLGVPIGRKMFPHCEGYAYTLEDARQADDAATRGEGLGESDYYDVRCAKVRQQPVNLIWKQSFGEFRTSEARRPGNVVIDWLGYRWTRIAAVRHNLETFLYWLLGVFVAGGLLGLGAPFWFKIFTRLSSVARPATGATLSTVNATDLTSEQKPLIAADDVSVRNGVRSSDPEIIDQLERGYVMVLTSQTDGIISPLEAATKHASLEDAKPGRQFGTRPSDHDPDIGQG
ncbi:MAG: hypothetical protein AAFY34_05440 [Pseudomonadota bacterium]